jgi:hypothetical protein
MRLGVYVLAILIGLGSVFGALWVMERISHPASGQSTTKVTSPSIPTSGPHPKVVVDATEFDFGTMVLGESSSHTFIIRNEGEVPLELIKLPATCQCVVGDLPDGKVPPGGQVDVTLTWTPKARAPEFRQMAPFKTNDPDNREIQLQIKGKVDVLYDLLPPDAWSFPDVPENQSVSQQGILVSPILDEFEVESVVPSKSSIEHEVVPLDKEELATVNAKSGYRIKVTLNPDKGIGPFAETVTITAKGKSGGPHSRVVNLVGQRLGPVRITGPAWQEESNALSLGQFDGTKGKKITLQLFVRGEGAHDFQFVKKSIDPEALKVELLKDEKFKSQGSSQRYLLTFEVPPGTKGNRVGDKAAVVKVETNHPKVPELTLYVHYLAF